MQMKMFSIFDNKAKIFAAPFMLQSTGAAVRAFEDLVSDERTIINRHPADFQLFDMGTFEDSTGIIVAISPYVLVATASEFKKQPSLPNIPTSPILQAIDNNIKNQMNKNHSSHTLQGEPVR